jgi:hypothetical protein
MRSLTEALCSPPCAGRKPGTPEGRAARALVTDALRGAGLDPFEQEVPGCNGANVLAQIPGDIDRYVLVGAHFDHLGKVGKSVFWGADDNAAAVAILVSVAETLAASRPKGRGVILAAFDGEEPPYFLSDGMGSERFAQKPPVPLTSIDMMVCMDLVGHALGGEGLPASVRSSLFALGAEKSAGTGAHIDAIARSQPGVLVRRADADIVPRLSDYAPFWSRAVPFVFLTSGRSRYYHTPEDTPEKLDYGKMEATARWLDRFVRETCERPEDRVSFLRDAVDDASTLRSVADLLEPLCAFSSQAKQGQSRAQELLTACDKEGRLPRSRRAEAQMLVGMLESSLA